MQPGRREMQFLKSYVTINFCVTYVFYVTVYFNVT